MDQRWTMNAKEVQHGAKVFGKVTEAKQDMDARVLASVHEKARGWQVMLLHCSTKQLTHCGAICKQRSRVGIQRSTGRRARNAERAQPTGLRICNKSGEEAIIWVTNRGKADHVALMPSVSRTK